MNNNLYFAYGSNLNEKDLKRWAKNKRRVYPFSKVIGKAYLSDYRLVFNILSRTRGGGVLNIEPALGCVVEGVIFEVKGEEGWRSLDAKEGYKGGGGSSHYDKVDMYAINDNYEVFKVKTYLKHFDREKEFITPPESYVQVVGDGFRSHGLDCGLLTAAAENKLYPMYSDAVFFYGTLMRGECRFHILEEMMDKIRCILSGQVRGRLISLGGYPGLIYYEDKKGCVHGEYVGFNSNEDLAEALPVFDGIEGFERADSQNPLYYRMPAQAKTADGEVKPAWTYVYASPPEEPCYIESGDWREHRGVKGQFDELQAEDS